MLRRTIACCSACLPPWEQLMHLDTWQLFFWEGKKCELYNNLLIEPNSGVNELFNKKDEIFSLIYKVLAC